MNNQNDSMIHQKLFEPNDNNSKDELNILNDLLNICNIISNWLINHNFWNKAGKHTINDEFLTEDHYENSENIPRINQLDLLINEKNFERAFKVELKLFHESFTIISRNNEIQNEAHTQFNVQRNSGKIFKNNIIRFFNISSYRQRVWWWKSQLSLYS